MKKLIIALTLLISACTFGEFAPNREKLHSMGNDICKTQPEKCINGVPW